MQKEREREEQKVKYGISLLTDYDIFLFRQGTHGNLWEKLGSHETLYQGKQGVLFSLWAPEADKVSVIGDFNYWSKESHPLKKREDGSGIWEGFIPSLKKGALYKYMVQRGGYVQEKADPFARRTEIPPKTASIVWETSYQWEDQNWMEHRWEKNNIRAPMSVYEVHLGSWKRSEGRHLSYAELEKELVPYVAELGFTHVEFLPVMEHPFYGSWGYQCTSYFAPTARYGQPEECMALVDAFHRAGIGVFFDWVPSHFPTDGFGLGFFDGTHLFEYEDMRKGYHKDWHSFIFDYSSGEVRSFLISSAMYWLGAFHGDGLRVDGVASMLYLDYSRKDGEWVPNEYGGRENIEAVEFFQNLNSIAYKAYPDIQMIAEESTAWPMVSRPVYVGGLGFGLKWNMGWMHDTLDYFSSDPIYRKYKHHELTFSLLYAYAENFCLPLSHDEVVHGKASLLGKMPGDAWQKRAQLRLLFGFFYAHPGKKLLFMGGEFGQTTEWDHEKSLDWGLRESKEHREIARWVRDLNKIYASSPALYQEDVSPQGFSWIDCHDSEQSVISFLRFSAGKKEMVLVVCNMTPVPRSLYRVGVPQGGSWQELLNSDALEYGGSGWGNYGSVAAEEYGFHGKSFSLCLNLPPFGILLLAPSAEGEESSYGE
ncbi:MAG TPA: 1,4-alpha-glucan branching protein GlgB [Synergistaceae bacterium]|nr:1,4-alpha-glucan branching protein GlgB [Synergistaceae bacterium]HPJ24824.1 1,4-alpha-glucan branching protein GlgB [Synergistaceae bacterium]HPQ36263.1 1,4-alpha-glucan branching protein GlgB [Synergistaceae bacterium]